MTQIRLKLNINNLEGRYTGFGNNKNPCRWKTINIFSILHFDQRLYQSICTAASLVYLKSIFLFLNIGLKWQPCYLKTNITWHCITKLQALFGPCPCPNFQTRQWYHIYIMLKVFCVFIWKQFEGPNVNRLYLPIWHWVQLAENEAPSEHFKDGNNLELFK